MVEEVGGLLRRLRERRGLSQNALARRMAVNPAYVNRLELGGRGASNRALLEKAAAALDLAPAERDALLGAAGHWPPSFQQLGPADPTLQLVADVLADDALSERQRALFRLHLRLAALPWRPWSDDEANALGAALLGAEPGDGG